MTLGSKFGGRLNSKGNRVFRISKAVKSWGNKGNSFSLLDALCLLIFRVNLKIKLILLKLNSLLIIVVLDDDISISSIFCFRYILVINYISKV